LTEVRDPNTKLDQKKSLQHFLFENASQTYPIDTHQVWGQIGLGDVEHWLSLRQLLAQHQTSAQLHLHIFESNFTVLAPFKASLSSLKSGFHTQNYFVNQLIEANLVPIVGCQRLIFNDGQFIIDLHLGPILASLQGLSLATYIAPNAAALFQCWRILDHAAQLDLAQFWQMARLSQDTAKISLLDIQGAALTQVINLANMSGFSCLSDEQAHLSNINTELNNKALPNAKLDLSILMQERRALRQSHGQKIQYCPQDKTLLGEIAIIGGGLASTNLALSLAQRHKTVRLFCQDSGLAQQASGNKQGAVYPLLTPDNGHLSHYFQQGLLFSRRRLQSLIADGFNISYDLCGVLQTGFDKRSTARLNKIITTRAWEADIAYAVSADNASQLAGIDINTPGIFYPLGGWVCPHEFTQAAFDKAALLSDVTAEFNCDINRIEQRDGQWYVYRSVLSESKQADQRHEPVHEQEFGPFSALVLANGQGMTQFEQSHLLAATGFRGQVSHIPARNKLAQLKTVLCAHGYMTPANKGFHCTGASYVKNPTHLDYCPQEQVENLHKMQHSYTGKTWVDDIDITGHSARVGVRMVTRDHAPMMGCAPDVNKIFERYALHQHTKDSIKFWQETPAPVHAGLYILGGLGSRGITSGPLAAEALAAQMCGELMPLDTESLAMLNPNRMWMRKLIKGKPI